MQALDACKVKLIDDLMRKIAEFMDDVVWDSPLRPFRILKAQNDMVLRKVVNRTTSTRSGYDQLDN